MPDRSSIARFYPDSYWWSGKERSRPRTARLLGRLERIYREFVVSDHVRFLERCAKARGLQSASLLDIGCGIGTFIYLTSRRGYRVYGMDVSSTAVRLARDLYGLEARQGDIGSDAWAGHKFDFVSMFHVLEHLPDAAVAIEYASSLLKPEGSLIVQVPNVDSLQATLFGLRWYGLDVPRHLINFSPAGLNLLLERTGFRVTRAARFSLRDNPAALASSIAPFLDPIGRKGRRKRGHLLLEAAAEFLYFILVAGSIPLAWAEGMVGRGATIWIEARRGDSVRR
ncbi:MAG: class I SAM-dependent methyltransferase [Acidobacteria bacterium]|nr:class I SAM-dependent methyltransferase [Acidobacteriota bacterium]